MNNSLIHLRVPAPLKGRLVRSSRAKGMKLSDYIASAVEAYMEQQVLTMVLPEDLSFDDLRVARDSSGEISFDLAPIETICSMNSIPIEQFTEAPEDNVASLLSSWYAAHLENGGARNATMDDMISEVQAENDAGQKFSLPEGRA